MVLEGGSVRSGVSRACSHRRPEGRAPLASPRVWRLLAVLSLPRFALPHHHMAFLPICLRVSPWRAIRASNWIQDPGGSEVTHELSMTSD